MTFKPPRPSARVLPVFLVTSLVALYASPGSSPSTGSTRHSGVGQGNVVNVSTVAQLQAAVASLTSGTTIVIAPGTYRLTQELRIRNGVSNVAIQGATSNRNDVVILGSGMNVPGINIALKVENAQDVTIADLSIGEAFYHPIRLQGEQGADRIRVSNVRLFDAGQQFLKSTVDPQNPNGVDDVIVEYSVIEYTVIGPDHGYTEGIDVHHGANWLIHHNLFRNISCPCVGAEPPAACGAHVERIAGHDRAQQHVHQLRAGDHLRPGTAGAVRARAFGRINRQQLHLSHRASECRRRHLGVGFARDARLSQHGDSERYVPGRH